jgi:hypothetical protein
MNNETETCKVDAKLEWHAPQLIDLDTDISAVAAGTGGLNDGAIEALS